MPTRLPKPKYKKPRLPDGDFFLVDDDGYEFGPLNLDGMGHNGGNEFVWSNGYSSPVFLRVLSQRGNRIVTEDGTGTAFEYEIKRSGAAA